MKYEYWIRARVSEVSGWQVNGGLREAVKAIHAQDRLSGKGSCVLIRWGKDGGKAQRYKSGKWIDAE